MTIVNSAQRSYHTYEVVTDRFRQAHQFDILCYQVSEGIYPASVRDQMVRASMLVDHILATDECLFIGDEMARILVVGGGPAGIATALRALQWAPLLKRNIEVTLLEQTEHCSRIVGNTTREIHPTIYEWPAPSYNRNQFPLLDHGEVFITNLNWDASCGDKITERLEALYNPFVHDENSPYQGTLIYQNPATVVDVPCPFARTENQQNHQEDQQGPDQVKVVIRNNGTDTTEDFHLAIFATGMGEEVTWLRSQDKNEYDSTHAGGYWGPRFWDKDLSVERYQGLDTPPRILISGGGDGGLQDFLRILTGKEASTLIHDLEIAFNGDDALEKLDVALRPSSTLTPGQAEEQTRTALATLRSARLWEKVKADIWEAEETYRRVLHWQGHTRYLDPGIKQVHDIAVDEATQNVNKVHKRSVWELFRTPDAAQILDRILEKWFEPRSFPEYICLVLRETVFTRCYPLNRFLAILTDHYLCVRQDKPQMIYPGQEITSITCGNDHERWSYEQYKHKPCTAVNPCWGKSHRVTWKGNPSDLPEEFDIIILRHGIYLAEDKNHHLKSVLHAPYQLLPYKPDTAFWKAKQQLTAGFRG